MCKAPRCSFSGPPCDTLHVASSVLLVFEQSPHLLPLQCPFPVSLGACARVHRVPKEEWLCWGHRHGRWKHWGHVVLVGQTRWNSGAGWWQQDKSPCCIVVARNQGNRFSLKLQKNGSPVFFYFRCYYVPLNCRNLLLFARFPVKSILTQFRKLPLTLWQGQAKPLSPYDLPREGNWWVTRRQRYWHKHLSWKVSNPKPVKCCIKYLTQDIAEIAGSRRLLFGWAVIVILQQW